jgi:uncharacterized protein (DUF2252 family)
MTIIQATQAYEEWLAKQITVIRADVVAKHQHMAGDPFSFLRATFYRWMQLWGKHGKAWSDAPVVLGVGDLHVENYGTWRDIDGRLIWGINDFDEAFPLPYTVDLARLTTSAWLAIELEHLSISPPDAAAAVLEGYTTGLSNGGLPFVLSEAHRWLRDAVTSKLRDPTLYWEKLSALPALKSVPKNVLTLLGNAMPEKKIAFTVAHRQAGLGSLGRERYTAVANWRGGKIARETKTLVPSACTWAGFRPNDTHIYYNDVVSRSARAADPFLVLKGTWILRRLSPFCSRIELSSLARSRDEEKLLWAMGRELANVHLGTRGAGQRILLDLEKRKAKWLRRATETMMEATLRDWKTWRKFHG